jgi:NAD(P)-dependent dehydrogenase (short-subunit alcohol dehydrogenase family)
MGLLDGKVAIVTGAGRGIGRGHALALAREGAQIVVNDLGTAADGEGDDRRPAQLVVDEIVADGGSASVNGDDVASFTGAQRLVQQAVEDFGRLDILVNNAGILRDAMSFNMTEAEWDAVVNVHLKGHFAPAHFAAAHWRERSKAGEAVSGRIINTASESGLFGNPGQSNYAAAKAGIVALTLVLARELERFGVTVNAIAPRARTRMTESLFGDFGKDQAFDPVDPEHISPLVAWLASDAAAHVSGQTFIAWGAQIQVVRGFEVVGEIDAGGRRWDPSELTDATKELFATRDPGVPPFGVPSAL